jgi:glycosyltransferase involved in cell wall biosynthesis
MRKIKLGVVFDQQIFSGGGFQQSLNAAIVAKKLTSDLIDVKFYTNIKENIKVLKEYEIDAEFISISFISKLRVYFYRKIKNIYLFNFLRKLENKNPREKVFIRDNIDIVYFLSPTSWPIDLEKTNYITTLWDLCHQDELEFPEVRFNKEFERREDNYRQILPKATAILVESNLTKINLIRRYGISGERIYITPFKAGIATTREKVIENKTYINIKKKYDLNVPYVFYPAQFWAHKNHFYLLSGLEKLDKKYNIKIGAIFSGTDKGNLNYIKDCVYKFGLSDRVRFSGFVSNEEIFELYKQSFAMVMPTFFGPTNLPPIEAFEIGVPVIYPDKKGLKDQVKDGALLIDLNDSNTMADQLNKLNKNEQLRKNLIKNGKKQKLFYNSINHVGILNKIIMDFSVKRNCWK